MSEPNDAEKQAMQARIKSMRQRKDHARRWHESRKHWFSDQMMIFIAVGVGVIVMMLVELIVR